MNFYRSNEFSIGRKNTKPSTMFYIFVVLCFTFLAFENMYTASVIADQKALIRAMHHNPACMVDVPGK